jgi:hypothetical protein
MQKIYSMKFLIAVALLYITSSAHAETSSLNLQLPNANSNFANDKFRAGDLDCSNAIGGATNFEFGVTGIIDNHVGLLGDRDSSTGSSTKDIGVYARVTIPLDKPKERINCNTLYQLELKKKRLEVMKLEEELKRLRELAGEE